MNFLFISEHLPIDTYASEVVFYRHFKLLVENGHNVHILTDQNSFNNRKKDLLNQFHIHILPNRLWYYLPFKPYGILKKIRFYGYYNSYTRKIIAEQEIDKIIGYVNGNFLMAFAAFVQSKSRLPLISFFHDDTNELNFGDDKKSLYDNTCEILKRSTKILIASEAFKTNWSEFSSKFFLLYPIANDHYVQLQSVKQIYRRIGYSGSVYNEILPSLKKFSSYLVEIKANLTIIGNNQEAFKLLNQYKEVTCLPLFATSQEANHYLISNCNVCLIAYPENIKEMPWINTCFPSKFIQYCILGIPTLIIAPANSALGKWCRQNNWLLYSETYDMQLIDSLLTKAVHSPEVARQVEYFRTEIFNTKIIQKKFEEVVFA